MRFEIFYEHRLPRPWSRESAYGHIVRLTPAQPKRKMAEKESARRPAGAAGAP